MICNFVIFLECVDSRASISGFCESRNHEIIISVWNGRVYHLDKEKDEFIPYPDKMRSRNPTVMVQDNEQDYFWLATWGGWRGTFRSFGPRGFHVCIL